MKIHKARMIRILAFITALIATHGGMSPAVTHAGEIDSGGEVQLGYFDEAAAGNSGSFYRAGASVEIPIHSWKYRNGGTAFGLLDLGADTEHRPGSVTRVKGPSITLLSDHHDDDSDFKKYGKYIKYRLDVGTASLDFEDAPNVGSFRFGGRVTGLKASGAVGQAKRDAEGEVISGRELCGVISLLSYTIGDNQILGMNGDFTRHPLDVSLCGKVRAGAVEWNTDLSVQWNAIIPGRDYELFGRQTPDQGIALTKTARYESGLDILLPERRSSDRERKIGIVYAVETQRSLRDDSTYRPKTTNGQYSGLEYVPGEVQRQSVTTHTLSARAAF